MININKKRITMAQKNKTGRRFIAKYTKNFDIDILSNVQFFWFFFVAWLQVKVQ